VLLLESARAKLSRLKHLWVEALATAREGKEVGRGSPELERGGGAQARQGAQASKAGPREKVALRRWP
jgi:hypothetical protein